MRDLWHRFEALLGDLLHWVEALAARPHGDWALFLLAAAESSFFPIPPDPLLIALCLGRPDRAFWFAGLCTAGSVIGGMIGYAIGFYGGRPLLLRFFARERVAKVERYYDRYNAWATGIAGLTPLPYKLFTLSGGAFAINFKVFVLASVLSRGLRFFAVATVVYLVGEPARDLIERHLGWLTVAFVILLVLGFLLVGRGAHRASRAESEPEPMTSDDRSTAAPPPAERPRRARRLIVTGRVQGVFFRDFTRRQARELGVSGWVRNRPDGSVEAEVAGSEAALDELARRLRRGPQAARVDRLDSEDLPTPAEPRGFEIRA